jgi:hypothetical protein
MEHVSALYAEKNIKENSNLNQHDFLFTDFRDMPSGRRPNTVSNIEAKIQAKQATLATPGINPANRAKTVKNISRLSRTLRSRSEQPPNPIGDMVRPPVAAVAAELQPVIEADKPEGISAVELPNDNSDTVVSSNTEGATATEDVAAPEGDVVPEATDVAPEEPVKKTIKIRLKKPQTIPIPDTIVEEPGCDKFYDPCSGIPLTEVEDPISFIQKKLTDIRRKKELTELKELESEILAKGTRLDLLKWFLTKEFNSLEEINGDNLLEFKVGTNNFSRSLFESYWDILLALGYIPGYETSDNRFMYNGKVENLTIIPDLDSSEHNDFIQNPFQYLNKRKIATSNVGGASDITIFYKSSLAKPKKEDPCSFDASPSATIVDKPKFIFGSSKKYKNEKSIDKYDILNIYGAAKQINPDEIDKKIILLVSDRTAVEEVKRRTKSKKYISEEASDTFGQDDMMASLRRLYMNRHAELERLEKNIVLERPYKLNLQLHQIMTVSVIANGITKYYDTRGPNNRFLVGILPRGGKTYIAGGIISKLSPKNIVVLLGAKSETQSQFIDELFLKFQDFYDYTVVNVKDENDPTLASGDLDPTKKHIFVMSIELFKAEDTSLEKRPLLKLLRGLIPDKVSPIDLIISDEAHLKQATQKAEKAVKGATTILTKPATEDEEDAEEVIDDTLAQIKNIPVVYLTGTYRKPKLAFKIPDENIVIWDYQDVQKAKLLDENMDYFTNSFGEVFKKALDYMVLTGKSVTQIKEDYLSFPEIHLLETHFYQGIEEQLLVQGDEKGMPDMGQLFIINKVHNFNDPSHWHNGFQFNTQMKRLIDFIGTDIMTSIDRICQRTGDRLRFLTSEFKTHSQLWFLPKMSGNPLAKRIMALAGMIFQHPWFRQHFHILAVTGKNTNWSNELKSIPHTRKTITVGDSNGGVFRYYVPDRVKSLKESVLEFEEEARKQNKGLIILAQKMLQLGISLPCVNIVALLDTGTDVDERIQKMYRALTQAPQKRDAFVIDTNYFRTITAVAEYQVQAFSVRKKREAGKEDTKEIYNSIFDIYSINDDIVLFETEEKRREAIEEIYSKQSTREYKLPTDLVDAGKKINTNVEDAIDVNVSQFDDLELHQESDKKKQKELIRKIVTQLKKAEAINREELFPGVSAEEFAAKPQSEIENVISKRLAYLDIFKILLRYGAIATDYPTVAKFKADIAANDDLQQEIYDLLLKKGVIKSSLSQETLFEKIILPNLEIFIEQKKGDSYMAMKEYLDDESKYPAEIQEVINYINEHLAPKQKEREQSGEVFTPLSLIDGLMSYLPEEVWKKHDWKWLDPANGIGNFPIKVFLKLDEGLKSWEPDTKKRRKHIVENMLYMIELRSKNSLIAKRLFSKLSPDSKVNLITADTLKLNDDTLKKEFGTTKFNIVMGNPPFNSGGLKIKGEGETIWPEFFKYGFEHLESNGYLILLHPPIWRVAKIQLYSYVKHTMLENQIIFMKSFEKDKALEDAKFEDTDVRFEYYILQKKPHYKDTIMNDIFGKESKVNVQELPYIPNAGYDILKKLFELQKKLGPLNFKTSSKTKEPGVVKYITNISDKHGIYFETKNYKYVDQDSIKICMPGSTARWPVYFVDSSKQFMSDRYIIVGSKSTGEKIANFLSSKLINFLIFVSHFEVQARIPSQLYESLPTVESVKDVDFRNDQEIYKFFKINKEDIELVEKYGKRLVLITDERVKNKKNVTQRAKKGGSRQRFNKTRRNRA